VDVEAMMSVGCFVAIDVLFTLEIGFSTIVFKVEIDKDEHRGIVECDDCGDGEDGGDICLSGGFGGLSGGRGGLGICLGTGGRSLILPIISELIRNFVLMVLLMVAMMYHQLWNVEMLYSYY
jgi:hypothetical protein